MSHRRHEPISIPLYHYIHLVRHISHHDALTVKFHPDYTDLYAFNFTDQAARTKDPRLYPKGPLTNEEAIRLITCKIQVESIESPKDGQTLPVVHFRGDSLSRHAGWDPNASSKLRG